MNREKTIQKIKDTATKVFRDLGINPYQHGEAVTEINPSFGFAQNMHKDLGVQSVHFLWMPLDPPEKCRLSLQVSDTFCGKGYFDNLKTYDFDDLTDHQLEKLEKFTDRLVFVRKREIESYKNNPRLEDFLQQVASHLKDEITRYPEYSFRMTYGRPMNKSRDCHVVLLLRDGHQVAYIPLDQDRFGMISCNLCVNGWEWGDNLELKPDDWKEKINKILTMTCR